MDALLYTKSALTTSSVDILGDTAVPFHDQVELPAAIGHGEIIKGYPMVWPESSSGDNLHLLLSLCASNSGRQRQRPGTLVSQPDSFSQCYIIIRRVGSTCSGVALQYHHYIHNIQTRRSPVIRRRRSLTTTHDNSDMQLESPGDVTHNTIYYGCNCKKIRFL